jgi:ribosomal protein L40E
MSSNVRICLVCNHENPASASRCAKCNAPLRVSKTVHLSGNADPQVTQEYDLEHVDLDPGMMALYFVGRSKPMVVPIEDGIILGRFSPEAPLPVVDLTDYSAGLLGVSRQHASVTYTDEGYTIEDLDSSNGTFVNETPVPPHTPRVLRNHDQIRLGGLILFVRFG